MKEPLHFENLPWWRYWVVPLALLAFWFPVNTSLAVPAPDFAPAGLLLNEAGLSICMMLPVYLAVLTLASSGVDSAILRIAGFIGAITGVLNVTEFFLNASYGWWLGVVHPLKILLVNDAHDRIVLAPPPPGHPQGDAPTMDEAAPQARPSMVGASPCGCPGRGIPLVVSFANRVSQV